MKMPRFTDFGYFIIELQATSCKLQACAEYLPFSVLWTGFEKVDNVGYYAKACSL